MDSKELASRMILILKTEIVVLGESYKGLFSFDVDYAVRVRQTEKREYIVEVREFGRWDPRKETLLETWPFDTWAGMLDSYWFCLDDREKESLIRKALRTTKKVDPLPIPQNLSESIEVSFRKVSNKL
jgi:hypothetical protein